MNILVAGGTGFVGGGIVRALLETDHAVSILTRRPPLDDPYAGRVTYVTGDATDPGTLGEALAGKDVVIDAVQFPNSPIENPGKGRTFERVDLGGTKNLVDAAKAAGAKQFIDISGAGAAPDAKYHWSRFKWQAEEHIKGSGVPYTVFRPSWLFGPEDVALNRFLGFAKFLPFIPVVGSGKARINPLFIDDLGAHVRAAVANDSAIGKTFEIGGPEVLTMNEIIRTALKVAGKRRFLFPQPKVFMKPVAAVIQVLPGRPLTPDAIDFITMDGVADTTELEATFGLRLTPLAEGLATYLGPRER